MTIIAHRSHRCADCKRHASLSDEKCPFCGSEYILIGEWEVPKKKKVRA